jgi:hypothetical protein
MALVVAFIADGATSSLAAHGEQGLADQSPMINSHADLFKMITTHIEKTNADRRLRAE